MEALLTTAAVCACALAVFCPPARATGEPFALHDGDRVVFYGDSITEQHFYTGWVENYVQTRFPEMHVRFWNAGVGGDRVTGGSGGSIDERLERDVFAHDPTVVTMMLGMNDGQYTRLTPAIEADYRRGYEHILQSIHQRAPRARVLCVGPSPYDDVTRPPTSYAGRYNTTLKRFGQIDRELATRYGATFTDANTSFVTALDRASRESKLATTLLVPDRVHPELAAHLLIAGAILRGWSAPSLVSWTALDAHSDHTSRSQAVVVSDLRRAPDRLSWSSQESALPLPIGEGNAALDFVDRNSGFSEEFNRELLQVANLGSGRWHLAIDGKDSGDYTAAQLASGINLALHNTPMQGQAQALRWMARDRDDMQFVQLRITIRKSSPGAEEALRSAGDELQEAIWRDAKPKPHHFVLERRTTL